MLDKSLRLPGQHLAGQVLGRAVAAGGEQQRPFLARLGQRILQRLQRAVRRHDQHRGDGARVEYRREVLARVEIQAFVDTGVDGERAVGHQQGAAVRCGLGHGMGADVAAGARPVLHHHGLAQALLQLLAQAPRQQVRAAARRKGHDDGDGPLQARAGLARRRQPQPRCARQQRAGRQRPESPSLQGTPFKKHGNCSTGLGAKNRRSPTQGHRARA